MLGFVAISAGLIIILSAFDRVRDLVYPLLLIGERRGV